MLHLIYLEILELEKGDVINITTLFKIIVTIKNYLWMDQDENQFIMKGELREEWRRGENPANKQHQKSLGYIKFVSNRSMTNH